jgi:WD40 repeat protein
VVYVQRFSHPISVLSWLSHSLENRRTIYDLALGLSNSLSKGKFYFDSTRVQWCLSLTPYSLPSGGLSRYFSSISSSSSKQYLFVGSTGSDLIVYRHDLGVYRALVPICGNGVRAIVRMRNDDLLCGGGDGTLTKLRGSDLSWEIIDKVGLVEYSSLTLFQIQVHGPILSLTLTASEDEVIIGCLSGNVYRCLTQSLTAQLITTAHTSTVTCLSFAPHSVDLSIGRDADDEDRSNYFVTGTVSGELRVWDISDYTCIGFYKERRGDRGDRGSISGGINSVNCVALYGPNNSYVLSGWKDGSIRCHDITLQRLLWTIPNTHRDGVTSLSVCLTSALPLSTPSNGTARGGRGREREGRRGSGRDGGSSLSGVEYLVTGGRDGAIRVWSLSSHTLITQHSEHTRPITSLLIDLVTPSLIHSCAQDNKQIKERWHIF